MSKRDVSVLLIGLVCGGLAVGGAMLFWQPVVRIQLATKVDDSPQQEASPLETSRPPRTPSQPLDEKQSYALDGYCPVTLVEHQRWMRGSDQCRATHGQQVFLFASAAEQQRFQQAPDRYAPAFFGNDIVRAKDNGETVRGKRKHGIFYDGQVLLFVGEESLQRFTEDPNRYLGGEFRPNGIGSEFESNRVVDSGK